MAYYDKGLFAAFAILAASMIVGIGVLAWRGGGFTHKSLLPIGTASCAGCWFNGLTRRISQRCSTMSCCLPYHFTHTRYDFSRIDIGDKCLKRDVRIIDARGAAGSLC